MGEQLDSYPVEGECKHLLARTRNKARIDRASHFDEIELDGGVLAISSLGATAPLPFRRVIDALESIEVHVPFETRPLWQQRELEIRSGPRWPNLVQSTSRLSRYARNLANCFRELKERGGETWRRMIERAQLGLGDDVRDFKVTAVGRGEVELQIVLGRAPDQPLPASALSDGQLSYLAFLALVELSRERSLVALDEPEQHLHPALLSRVVWHLEELAESCPVVVATHSDRFLDALANPAHSVVLCDLDERGATVLRRPRTTEESGACEPRDTRSTSSTSRRWTRASRIHDPHRPVGGPARGGSAELRSSRATARVPRGSDPSIAARAAPPRGRGAQEGCRQSRPGALERPRLTAEAPVSRRRH